MARHKGWILPRIARINTDELHLSAYIRVIRGKEKSVLQNMVRKKTFTLGLFLIAVVLFLTLGCSSCIQRKLLYFPSHRPDKNGLAPWSNNREIIGYSRIVESPVNVWLMIHGNAGQASDRAYALPCISSDDSVFILEYPGYGLRKGVPSRKVFNLAAREAYLLLRETYPKVPVCVVAESLGSGPACTLAALTPPPDKFVLIVPFEKLSLVARDHFPAFIVSLLLRDEWDNVEALSHYKGPVDIFGMDADTVIPVVHAKALAAAVPPAKFTLVPGGHNEWSESGRVSIRNP
jgi:pimeloyl-ACP methyl ester carboxylesterase